MTKQLLYCIEHESMIMAEDGELGMIHSAYSDVPYEWDWCEFPCGYAYCPPPEEDEDYWSFVFSQDEVIECLDA